jgi:hypothetical protein
MRILLVLFKRDKALATQQASTQAITFPLRRSFRFHPQPLMD